VGRIAASQLRPLLVVWLLLTVPVVCHGETMVMVLDALTGRQSADHGAAALASAHHAHGPLPVAQGLDVDANPPAPAADGPMWCAHTGSDGIPTLPTGQHGFLVAGPLRVAVTNPLGERVMAAAMTEPTSLNSPPPAPPPRFLA
jgi:hypothetical protein